MPAEIALPSALTLASDTHHVGRDTSHVGLLALVFTERRNVARRAAVRQTWLSHAWSLPSNFTWRYAFVEARAPRTGASKQSALRGDTLVLASVEESYLNLVHKTVAALRWSLAHVPFDTLLKTDDDSIVHVGRAAAWLAALPSRQRVYAGRVVRDSQVVRSNFTRADLVHPDWFPADFLKWAVGVDQMPDALYPPYCAGAGYFVGRHTARAIVGALARRRAPPFTIEDAFVGVLARDALVEPTDVSSRVQDPPAGRPQTADHFRGQILVHRVADMKTAMRWLLEEGGGGGGGGGDGGACAALKAARTSTRKLSPPRYCLDLPPRDCAQHYAPQHKGHLLPCAVVGEGTAAKCAADRSQRQQWHGCVERADA